MSIDPIHSWPPNWDPGHSLYIEFDPYGDCCAVQCRHARRTEDQYDDEYAELDWAYQCALKEHGIYSVLTLRAWSELRAEERERPERYWMFRDPVFLGPYTREALVGRDDYREF